LGAARTDFISWKIGDAAATCAFVVVLDAKETFFKELGMLDKTGRHPANYLKRRAGL
jgi:hypothetical protein